MFCLLHHPHHPQNLITYCRQKSLITSITEIWHVIDICDRCWAPADIWLTSPQSFRTCRASYSKYHHHQSIYSHLRSPRFNQVALMCPFVKCFILHIVGTYEYRQLPAVVIHCRTRLAVWELWECRPRRGRRCPCLADVVQRKIKSKQCRLNTTSGSP